jgi:hypothetical protein
MNLFEGQTLEMIGQRSGVSRERVRQILEPVIVQCNANNLRGLRDFSRRDISRRDAQLDNDSLSRITVIGSYIREHPGILRAELMSQFPDEIEEVNSACAEHSLLVLDTQDPMHNAEFEDRLDIIESLQAASLLSFPLTGVAYDQLVAEGYVKGLSRQRILQVYGSWNEACRRAGVEPGEPLKNVTYVRKFSELEMIRVVGQFLLDQDRLGRAGGRQAYAPWRESHDLADSIPSEGTICNQVNSSWTVVRRLALLDFREHWIGKNGHDGNEGEYVR